MRYHINKDFEAKPCRVKTGRCPFGGATGNENHFDTLAEARKNAEILIERKHSVVSSKKRPVTETQIDTLLDSLVESGLVRPDVASSLTGDDQIVEKVFKGDKSAFRAYRNIALNDEFQSGTQHTLIDLVRRGLPMSIVSTVLEIDENEETDDDDSASQITVVDDVPQRFDWDDLRSGAVTGFKPRH